MCGRKLGVGSCEDDVADLGGCERGVAGSEMGGCDKGVAGGGRL